MNRQLLAMLVLLACGLAPERLPIYGWSEPIRVRDRLRDDLLSRSDYDRMENRYYERLVEIDCDHRLDRIADQGIPIDTTSRAPKQRSGLWSVSINQSPLIERVDDLREIVFRPNGETESGGVLWTTNAQGLRDQPYQTQKPPGTFRIALVGDSIGAGWGVDASKRFESILEEVWNDRSRSRGGETIEVINCAVPGHSPGQRWSHFLEVGLPMEPDLILYEATAADIDWDERRLRVLLARGIGWDSPLYRDVLEKVGARPGGNYESYKRILKPWHWQLLTGVYHSMTTECRSLGIPIVWILVPRVGRTPNASEHARLVQIARASGFSYIADVSDTFDGIEAESLAVDPADFHPNAQGHALLAVRLNHELSPVPEIRSAWDPPAVIEPFDYAEKPRRDEAFLRASDESFNKNSSSPSGAHPR